MIRWWRLAGLAALASSTYCFATDDPWFYKYVVMKAFRAVDPETAHVMAIRLAQLGLMPTDRSSNDRILASF